MPSLVRRLVLLLLLGLAAFVLDPGQASENAHREDEAPNLTARQENQATPVRQTVIPEHLDPAHQPKLNITWKHTSSGKRDVGDEGVTFITTGFKGLARAIHAYASGDLVNDRKRTVDNRSVTWNYDIPVIFDDSYPDLFLRNLVTRVLRHISSRTCLNIKDETSRWNSSNSNWFSQNGYVCNCYVLIIDNGTGCSTSGTGPINGGPTKSSVCHSTNIILHEFLHTLGIIHEQQAFTASRYISLFHGSITPSLLFTYESAPYYSTKNFDSTSTELYDSGTWSQYGDDTYAFIRDLHGKPDQATSNENVIFEQLNKRYNCSTKACAGNHVDCYPGYLTRQGKTCKCVCPPEFNSTTNCKTFKEGADKTRKWNFPISFFAGGSTNACPSGFQPTGWFSHCGTWLNPQTPSPARYPTSGTTTHYPICSKIDPTENVDWNSIPLGGRYCFIKPKGVSCGGPLTEATVQIQSLCAPQHNGSLGDITFDSVSKNITIKLCCLDTEHLDMEAELPNDTPFRLFAIYHCPNVLDMRTYRHELSFWTPVSSNTGTPSKPLIWVYSAEMVTNMCYYQPAVYGCSRNITLTAHSKTVTITTPGYPGPRPANKRCFYCFNGPTGSQFRVTFNVYDLEFDDKMRIKPFHKWGPPSRINNDNPLKQIVTESNYLCMEFWTGYLTNATNKGANFTVDLLTPTDSCYDTSVNGMDYVGTTNVSETNEPCLTWKEALNCYDFSFSGQVALTGYYESNYCRNPGGNLLQPWCYVYRNDSSCMKRYCDVCNTKVPADTMKPSDCATYIRQDPNFCHKNYMRFLCFKSCGMSQAPAGSPGTCSSPPPVPSDGNLVGSAKASYKAGERVYVQCKKNLQSDNSTKLVVCTRNGWKGPVSACLDCPTGYTLYGDRCIYFTTTATTRPGALAFCNSLGRNGTLMHVRNATDHALMSSIRNKNRSYNAHSWFGAYLCNPAVPTWCFLGTSIPITYQNWDHDTVPSNPKYDVVYMYRETSTSGRNTKFVAISSNDTTTKNTFFCQIDRTYPPVLEDRYSTCQSVLNDDPTFCKDQETMVDSALFCAKSCGLNPATHKCSEPTSATYTRTSGTGPISTGDYMTFKCNAGYFKTGGDASRACGLAGLLLGKALVCDSNPTSVDMGLPLVRKRATTLDKDLTFIMDMDGYRVPISGKLTTWYYFCEEPGLIYFVVFRKSGTKYNVIGSNHLTCTAGFRMSFSVPTGSQIPVHAGDMVGAWSSVSYLLSVTTCDTAAIKLLNIPTASPSSYSALLSTTSYPTKKCIIPALGFRVEK